MKENQKILIKNLTNHVVGFGCVNFPAHYDLNAGQTLSIKWEHVEDASYSKGFRYMLENTMLKVDPKTENYEEVMDELQLSNLKEIIDNSLSYEDAKKLLKVTPLAANYNKIKEQLDSGTQTTKENIANAAIELQIKDYMVNTFIKKATGIDVIKTLELNSSSEEKE